MCLFFILKKGRKEERRVRLLPLAKRELTILLYLPTYINFKLQKSIHTYSCLILLLFTLSQVKKGGRGEQRVPCQHLIKKLTKMKSLVQYLIHIVRLQDFCTALSTMFRFICCLIVTRLTLTKEQKQLSLSKN